MKRVGLICYSRLRDTVSSIPGYESTDLRSNPGPMANQLFIPSILCGQ